jgi:predicted transcriptional regulator
MEENIKHIPELNKESEEENKVPSLGRFVFGSGPRIRIFRDIQQGVHYSELTDIYADSLVSSTVNDFRDKNLIYKTDQDEVHLTPLGKYILDNYAGLIGDLKSVVSVSEFFDALSPDAYDYIDQSLIKNGETVSGSLVDKNAVIYDYVENIREAKEIKEIVPTLIRAGVHTTEGKSIYGKQIMEGNLECTFIHTEGVYNVISDTEQYRQSEAREHQDTNRVNYYRYDNDFPFTLTIYDDDMITILTYDDDGIGILFKSSTEACVEWANDIFSKLRQESERFNY